MHTAKIPAATIGTDLYGSPMQIGVDEFKGSELCVVAGQPGSGTTAMLLLLASSWTDHMQVVIVGRGDYPPPYRRLLPQQLPKFLADHRSAANTLGTEATETLLLLDHFLPPHIEGGIIPPARAVESAWTPSPLDELAPFEPVLFDNAFLHVVMRWPRGEESWMQITDQWNVTAAVVIEMPVPGFITDPAVGVVDRRDGRPSKPFILDINGRTRIRS
jgi:hypothetical protein